ncbi:TonB-dependent receptor [Parahaliea mediterranea]|uniref:TonB-dependent receptor n=1 Tax=Parahaliea mediterranea TaxID=651086 RepID=A0A939INZ1_9GAMM|nr:TonB-dependent receptor [Parahaliea mediterranea]MBN7799050.1 TonB-dependent receptor [Parahaliea mediterranea]
MAGEGGMQRRKMVGVTTGLCALSAAFSACAQAQGGGLRLLEEVVVTAQKRAENSQDVPITMTAFSGDDMIGLGLSETSELGQFIPGLELSTTSGEGSQLIIFLRGAGLNDFNTNNAGPIGIYTDEVYISSPILTSFQFFDSERLEILKGPQGTLYGRNTTGGAVKFISNKPGDEFEFKARASYGRFDSRDLEVAVSGPVSDKVSARVAFKKADSAGYIKNRVTGGRDNGTDTLAWRGTVDIDVTDNFFLRANIHGATSDSEGFSFNHLGVLPGGVDALGYSGPDDEFTGEYNEDNQNDLDSIGGYIEARLELDTVSITSISAFDGVDSLVDEETDASPLSLISIDYGVESETFSQELRVSGESGSVEWLVGGFYLKEDLDQDQTVDLFGELRGLTGGVSDPFGWATGGAPVLFARTLNAQESESFAVFSQADIALTDRLTLTLGGRYTDESRTFDASTRLEDEVLFGAGGLVIYDFDGLKLDDDAFSWRAGLDFAATDNVLVYASVASGFKSGGFNGGFLSLDAAEAAVQLEPYEPEYLTAYEIGVKSDLFDNSLRLNAALFLNDFSDLQVFTLVNTETLPIQVLDNASSAQVVGLEFDITYYPTDNLLVSVSGALLDSELKDFVSDEGLDFSGNELARTPDTSVTGLIRYDHELSDYGNLYAQASAAYKSSVFFSTENNPLIAQDGYTLVNARVGYQHSSHNWELALFVNNLGNETYFTNATDLSDFGLIPRFVGMPRMWGVELAVNF